MNVASKIAINDAALERLRQTIPVHEPRFDRLSPIDHRLLQTCLFRIRVHSVVVMLGAGDGVLASALADESSGGGVVCVGNTKAEWNGGGALLVRCRDYDRVATLRAMELVVDLVLIEDAKSNVAMMIGVSVADSAFPEAAICGLLEDEETTESLEHLSRFLGRSFHVWNECWSMGGIMSRTETED